MSKLPVRPFSLTIILAMVAAVAACGDDDTATTGQGGSTSQGGASTSQGGALASQGGASTAPGGSSSSTGGVTSCAQCQADEYCVTCNMVNTTTYSCPKRGVPQLSDFSCGGTSCSLGSQVCKRRPFTGDGCSPVFSCAPTPSTCPPNDANCACVAPNDDTCVEGPDGGVTYESF